MKDVTIVVNLSLRSIRLIVFDSKGVKIYEDWLPVRTYIDGLSVEQDPNEWWSLLCELLRKFGQQHSRIHVSAITVTSSALCLVVVDKSGRVLQKAMMVSDKRAIDEAEALKRFLPEFQLEGKPLKIDSSFMFPKILWIKKHSPRIFSNTRYFLSANDFLISMISGKVITDVFNSQKFYYDAANQRYPKKVLDVSGVRKSQLPAVVEPGTVIGGVLADLGKEFPFLSNSIVVVSTYDALCALFGSSTYEPGELNNVCGTCSSYRILSNDKAASAPRLLEQKFTSENLTIIGGSNNLEGGVLEWAKECYYSDAPKDDNQLYALMEKEAGESSLGANGLLFMPYLIGERLPISDAFVRGMFFGMERFHTRKDIIRSVFEANAFQAKLMLEEFEKSGIEISAVNMSGGVAKLKLAAKIRADVLGIPVHVLSEVETTALGAFILTQKARGKFRSIQDGKHLVQIKHTYLPNMHNHNCYASLLMLYKELYTANAGIFKKRHEIFEGMIHYQRRVLENL